MFYHWGFTGYWFTNVYNGLQRDLHLDTDVYTYHVYDLYRFSKPSLHLHKWFWFCVFGFPHGTLYPDYDYFLKVSNDSNVALKRFARSKYLFLFSFDGRITINKPPP